MADLKISQLVSATTPLAGTEVLPIVQSGSTKKVSINDLTAGRTLAASIGDFTKATAGDAVTWTNGGANAKKGFLYSDNQYIALLDIGNAGNGTGILIDSSNANLYLNTVGGTKLSLFSSSGDVKVNTGNLVIGTSGKGIDFSATAGTGTSELLADYEEGTWSGGTLVGSNCSSITLSNATYTKIGRLVCIEGKFSATLTTTLTEVDIYFTLPFSTLANTCPAVGNVSHTLSANVGTGVIADSTGGEATTAYLGIASSQVTKANGTAFTASFSFSYAVA